MTVRPGETDEPDTGPRAPCLQCGGKVDDDGYCTQCGTKAPSPRDHFEERPAPWVAGVCDRGIRHYRNEDAMAMAVDGPRVVLVVCDGVSNTVDSHIGSHGRRPRGARRAAPAAAARTGRAREAVRRRSPRSSPTPQPPGSARIVATP